MNPKLFISYSWSSEEHGRWVIDLATNLRESGVDVILDKWDLKEGNDANAFMEKMVTDPEVKKVILVCDRHYADKADKRKGGVGTETQIISPEIYSKQDQNKFVAVIAEKDENGNPFLPTFYKSRIYIDLSNTEQYAQNYDQLLRWIYDKPLYVKPEIGAKPSFLEETEVVSLGTTSRYNRAMDAMKHYRQNIQPSLRDYFDIFSKELERFRITQKEGEFDDQVVRSIEQFIPYRNEIINLFITIAQYSNTKENHQLIFRFFEDLIPYRDRPEGVQTWMKYDFDNFRFIIHELFLYMIASFIKYEAFDAVSFMLRNPYLIKKSGEYPHNTLDHFLLFRPYLESLEHRNKRLNLRKLSLHADLLEQRSKGTGFHFEEIMQTDFILYVRGGLDTMRTSTRLNWFPVTLVYAGEVRAAFEIFARSQTKEYFNLIAPIFGVKQKEDFQLFWDGIKQEKIYIPRWEHNSISPHPLMGYDLLATR
jgi:hypothetical protein